jgi:hypothetical protein
MSLLEPKASIATSLAVCAIVYGIHTNFTPTVADIQGLPAGNKDIDSSERKATWLSAGVVAAVSLLAKDPTIFILGSGATIALAWMTRQATWTESQSGPAVGNPGQSLVSANDTTDGPQMTTADYHMFSSSEFVSS